jgi:hypothetical protein
MTLWLCTPDKYPQSTPPHGVFIFFHFKIKYLKLQDIRFLQRNEDSLFIK